MPDPIRALRDDPFLTPSIAAAVEPTGGPAPPKPGSSPGSVDRYLLGQEIARGGMGVVYRATDTFFDRSVAIKVLQDRFTPSSGVARRFLDEARITGQLQHPAIPPAHDVGVLPDGRPFLAMKLIQGKTLADLLAGRERELPELIGVFEQICQAVAFAHSQGVIHRDLKPANVMVGAFGEVQVMDWGLAKGLRNTERDHLVAPRSLRSGARDVHTNDPNQTTDHTGAAQSTDDHTQSGQALGTPAYMPPEQARGEIERVDCRSDVFALGGILCAILTGTPPFTGTGGAEVLRNAAAGNLSPAFARLDSCDADAELIAVCRRCLSALPAPRPADARELAALVAQYRADVEARLRTAERATAAAGAKAVEQHKKRRVQLMLAMAIGLLFAAAGAFAYWQETQSNEIRRSDLKKQYEAEQRAIDNRNRVTNNGDALAAHVKRCADALRAGDEGAARDALTEIDRRLPEGGGDALTHQLAVCRDDLAMLEELNRIDDYRWTPAASGLPGDGEVARLWRTAFEGFGVSPESTPRTDAADRISRSALRTRLTATLDLWFVVEPSPGVRTLLAALDPDPYRDRVRDAVLAQDRTRVSAVAGQPEALGQTPGFAAALGHHTAVPLARRRAVLDVAIRSHPSDLTLLMAMGDTFPSDARAGVAERLRWHQAALAAAPMNPVAHFRLGLVLRQAGDRDGAAARYRDAIRLNPEYTQARVNLGASLAESGDPAGAAVELREAIRLNPAIAWAHYNLGVVLDQLGDLDGAIGAFREAARLDRPTAPPDPHHARIRNNLGIALYEKGSLDEAVVELRLAVQFNPDEPSFRSNLNQILKARAERDAKIAPAPRAVMR